MYRSDLCHLLLLQVAVIITVFLGTLNIFFVDVPLTARIMTEEIFGPILPVLKVKGTDEA